MSSEEFKTSETMLIELLSSYEVEIRERGLVVHSELDSHFPMRNDPLLDRACEHLLRFVFSTLPDGCEFYLAAVRANASVSRLGSGTLTLRWQVSGEARRPMPAEATAIRPIAGGAALHADSVAAVDLEQAFLAAGWTLELEPTQDDRELWVHAMTR